MARLSSREKFLECFASTGVNTPVTMSPNSGRREVDRGPALPWATAFQFRSAEADPRTPRLDALSS